MEQAKKVRLRLNELVRRLLGVAKNRYKVLQWRILISSVVITFGARYLNFKPMKIFRDFLNDFEKAWRNVPECRELGFDASGDVALDDVLQYGESVHGMFGKVASASSDAAVAFVFFLALAGVIAYCCAVQYCGLILVDDALAPGVETLLLNLLAAFEKPFEKS